MALRFQQPDEVDNKAKEERRTGLLISQALLWLLCLGIVHWLSGDGLASLRESAAITIGVGFVIWTLTPLYQEFRIRTKEIDGKVSALGESVDASRVEILGVLDKLDPVQYTRDIYELKLELQTLRHQLDAIVGRK